MLDTYTRWGYIKCMSKLKSNNPNLSAKLNRVSGQVDSIKTMLENERDCVEVVTQIAAARSALGSIARDLLTEEACLCASSPKKNEEFNIMLKKLFDFS